MAFSEDPNQRFNEIADGFSLLVAGVTDWDAPTPVKEWKARDIVFHLTDWLPGLLQSASSVELPVRDPQADPAQAWETLIAAVQLVLAKSETAEAEFSEQHVGTMTVAQGIDMLYTPDVFMHSWDLAKASNQKFVMDEDFAKQLFAGLSAAEEAIRSSGHYGTLVVTPADADVTTKLIGLIGRDPNWSS